MANKFPNHFSKALDKITQPVFKKKGLTYSRIVTDWEKIIGTYYAQYSTPRKIIYSQSDTKTGVLYVNVENSSIGLELSYQTPVILEKISTYFGYKAVDSIKLIQSDHLFQSTIADKNSRENLTLSKHDKASIDTLVEDVEDNNLRDVLTNLGAHIYSKE